MKSTVGVKLLLLILAVSFAKVSARIGVSWAEDVEPRRLRSIDSLSSEVFEELHRLHSTGAAASLQFPNAARRIHRIVVEGSADEGEDFDHNARGRALKALNDGSDRLLEGISQHEKDMARRVLESGDSRQLGVKGKVGIALFSAFVIFLVVLVITNIINGVKDTDTIDYFANDNAFLTGTPGTSFKSIFPCNRIPLQLTPTKEQTDPPNFSYLPVTQGLTGRLSDPTGDVLGFFKDLFNITSLVDEGSAPDVANCVKQGEPKCKLTSDCCKRTDFVVNCNANTGLCDSVVAGADVNGFSIEPFCLLWSESDKVATAIDTFAFVPATRWPPIVPLVVTGSILPKCALPLNELTPGVQCVQCEYYRGFELGRFAVGPFMLQLTIQFGGVAFSWGDKAKLAFGTNDNTEEQLSIWDGFLNVIVPEVPDINFWTQWTLNIIPAQLYDLQKKDCENGIGIPKKLLRAAFRPEVALDFELYIGFDKTTDKEEAGKALAGDLVGNNRKLHSHSEGEDLWRQLQETSEDPCVILTATALRVTIPIVGSIIFGNAIGGFCNFSPIPETGVRCTPSGFFINIEQEFTFKDGLLSGLLSSIFAVDEAVEAVLPKGKSGNSVGIFQNPDGENEAIVLRLEFPVTSLFGVTVGGPRVHFQVIRGSEVERRRQTILRKRSRENTDVNYGEWVNNCPLLNCNITSWAPFYKNMDDAEADNKDRLEQTQICSDILLNPDQDADKLLYYNRVLTADTLDPSLKFDKVPPPNTSFIAPPEYSFENNPTASVVIVYLELSDISVLVISIRTITVTLILSDGPPATNIDQSILTDALDAYGKLADDLKAENGGVWAEPNGDNFPDLQAYKDYLPMVDSEGNILPEDILAAYARAVAFNDVTDELGLDRLAVFLKLYCDIGLLFFIDIEIGLILENFVDNDPNKWFVAGDFKIELLGLLYSVSARTNIDFDSRRRRHLESSEYERALVQDGLQEADWTVGYSVSCAPGSACKAIAEFFKDVGEAVWKGVKAIGKFFEEDVANFAKAAIALVGEWGKAFIGAIEDFANDVADDFKKVFEEGGVAQIVTSGRVEAFGDDAASIVSSFSDGKYDLKSFVQVGRDIINLVVDGVVLAAELILAGVLDVVNAIGSFFENVAGAVVKALTDLAGTSKNYNQLRQGSAYYVPTTSDTTQCNAVLANPNAVQNDIKRFCWFTDELDCRVKLPEVRTCDPQPFYQVDCTGYRLVDIEQNGGFPRFDGREFDRACREEKLAKLAMAEEMHGNMKVAGKVIDVNFQENFRGLSNFADSSPSSRRKLQDRPEMMVQSVEIPFFAAVGNGTSLDQTVSPPGNYNGAALQSNTPDAKMVDTQFDISFDFSAYKNPGDIPRSDNDGGKKSLQMLQRGAAAPYLDGVNITDPAFLAKQPIILPPKLSRDNNAGPFEFKCVDTRIAKAFKSKLQSASPETLLRKRTRRLLSDPFDDSVLEIILERILVEKIKANEGIQVVVTAGDILGGGDGTDLFDVAKGLLGTEGAGAFLDPDRVLNRRRLQRLSISDFEVKATVTKAIPFCDRLEWEFNVTATDISGTSNTVVIDAFIMFGNPEISDVASVIQTRCDSTPIGVEELEDNSVFKNDLGVDTLKPVLKVENCPSPYLFLQADADIVVHNGTICTTDYKTIQRNWSLKTTEPECGVPTQVFTQVITLGGLTLDGTPATPMYKLQDSSYDLPNIRVATIATQVSDFYLDGIAPSDECGICNDPPGIAYSHPQNFECSEVGVNPVDVAVLNTIGVSVTKSASAFVFDDFPTNIITKPHTVFLNKFGSLSEADVVTVEDIDDGSWDNCGIRTRVVGPTPIYQCGDEGPQTTRLKIVDVNDNGSFQDETVTVDDSRRLAIGEDRYLSIVRRETENLVAQKLADDFVYHDCYEFAVYLRLKGESNFFRLEYPPELLPGFPGWNGDSNWVIPPYNEYDPESLLFHQALCDGVPLKQQGPSPCVAELKAEVLCTDGLGERRQTCYRAKLVSTDECPNNDEKALPTRVGKGSRSQDGCA